MEDQAIPEVIGEVIPWRKNPRRSVTVEITIFLYIAAYALEIPVLQQYLYERAKQDLGMHREINNTICLPNNTDTSTELEKKVQQKASNYILVVIMALTLPAVVSACFVGSWSDKRGRKGPMLLVLTGAALNATFILVSMYLNLPVYVIMIACGIEGVCGYYPTMILALLAFAADTIPAEKRAMKLGILEAIAFVSGMLSQLGSGYWIVTFGYESVFWAILSFHLLGIIYIYFFLPESFPEELRDNAPICSWKSMKTMFAVYTKKRRGGRWVLAVLLLSSVLTILAAQVVLTLIVLYGKRSPLCWSSHIIGYFLATQLFVKAVGAVGGIKLCLVLGYSNYLATQIGLVFLVGSLITIGFSNTTTEMFISTGVGIFSGIPQPCIRAQMSKMVNKEEQGALFAVLAALESLCQFSSQLIFNPLYAWTVTLSGQYVAGLSFFINAGLAVIPIILIAVIQCCGSHRHRDKYPPLLEKNQDT